jgi:hypothetical protein
MAFMVIQENLEDDHRIASIAMFPISNLMFSYINQNVTVASSINLKNNNSDWPSTS